MNTITKFLFGIFLLLAITGFAQTEGPNSATDVAVTVTSDNDWSFTTEIYANDDSEAYATADALDTEAIAGLDYGFSINTTATINGVEVMIRKRYDPCCGSGNVRDRNVKLVVGGTISGNDRKTTTNWPATFTDVTYGGPTDLWGLTLTPTNINATDFGASIKAKRQGGSATRYADIDYISIKVYYTVPMPVELIKFIAVRDGTQVLLSWETASETNNDYFTVERSIDLAEWKELAQIQGHGTTSSNVQYTHKDQPNGVKTYYRLKQVDYDGVYEYSSIVAVLMPHNTDTKKVVKVVNHLGQEVPMMYFGVKMLIYDDGSTEIIR